MTSQKEVKDFCQCEYQFLGGSLQGKKWVCELKSLLSGSQFHVSKVVGAEVSWKDF